MSSATDICNMALGRLGAKRINNYADDTDTKEEAIQCRLFYIPTRDALLRSHWWRFARDRDTLSADAGFTADEWDYAYDLPADFLRFIGIWDESKSGRKTSYSMVFQGTQILSNETSMKIWYVKKVTDPAEFDPLFVELLSLKLAMKMSMTLGGGGSGSNKMRQELYAEMTMLERRVRLVDKQEQNNIGRADMGTWNDARY